MPEQKLKGWHHLPDVPLKVSPFFTWPLNPLEMIKWVWNSWFLISEKLIIVGIAFASYYWFQPSLEVTKTFAAGWIAEMYVRNLLLALIVGGGLHLWFYTFSARESG